MPGYSGEDVELARVRLVVTCVVIGQDAESGEDTALILKRSEKEKEGPGLWTIPGGKVRERDLGEALKMKGISHHIWMAKEVFARAILREIKEETRIQFGCAFPLGDRTKIFTRQDGTPTLVLVYWTVCAAPPPRVRIGSESTAYSWVKEEELENYQFIGNVRDDIKAALQHWSRQHWSNS